MKRRRDQFFSRPGLAKQQNRSVARCRLARHLVDAAHRFGVANQVFQRGIVDIAEFGNVSARFAYKKWKQKAC